MEKVTSFELSWEGKVERKTCGMYIDVARIRIREDVNELLFDLITVLDLPEHSTVVNTVGLFETESIGFRKFELERQPNLLETARFSSFIRLRTASRWSQSCDFRHRDEADYHTLIPLGGQGDFVDNHASTRKSTELQPI